jgi:hypothetical protein
MGSGQRSSSNEAPQTTALIFLVTAPHLPIQKSRQTSSSTNEWIPVFFKILAV